MKRLVTAAVMREMDRTAIEGRGIAGADLMENAGAGAAAVILEHFDVEDGRLVVVLCGKGNNGGDGFVIARHLKQAGATPVALLLGARIDEVRGDAAGAMHAWSEAGGETRAVTDSGALRTARPLIAEADLLVDAMLGTGAIGAPRGLLEDAVDTVNAVDVPVVAVDIPSGLDADTGAVPGACVIAALTATLALPKRGLYLYPGREFVGHLAVVDIGIPEEILDGPADQPLLVEPRDCILRLPDREPEMHKGDRGHLLVVGGSAGLTGAVALAAEAAVRAGAGKVTAGVPLSLLDVMEVKLTEAMVLGLPELDVRALSQAAFDRVMLFDPGRLTALAVGPGAGRHRSTRSLFRRILEEIHVPTVLDADGIHAFAGAADLLRTAAAGEDLILTPHLGEFCTLTGMAKEDVLADRFDAVRGWAKRLDAVIVLKGAPTLIAEPDGVTVYLNPTGSEALATGGSGDVLTGLIAGFLAQGVAPVDAAVAGVYVHGMIADFICETWNSPYGLKAGDLIEAFTPALADLLD